MVDEEGERHIVMWVGLGSSQLAIGDAAEGRVSRLSEVIVIG